MFEINVRTLIEENRVADLIVTGIEGGCEYWLKSFHLKETTADITESPWYSDAAVWMDRTTIITATFEDGESDEPVVKDFTIATLHAALQLFAEEDPKNFSDLIKGNEDANTADLFFQYWILGSVVFG